MLSISTVKFMLSCLEEIYSGTNVQIQVIQKVKKESSTYLLEKYGLNSAEHLSSQFSSWCERKMLINIGPIEGIP